jgi:4-diphosphocytidyl-2-C-methyl-D-erythritol kinase
MAEAAAGVRSPAPAKINLYLHVVGRLADGYHLLDSLIVFAGIGDTLTFAPAEGPSLAVDGPFAAGVPAGEENLVLKAARALAEAAHVHAGVAIRLTKRLPPASGLGGGSADAAATLRALKRLWDLRLDDATLAKIALALGADVPVCVQGRAAFVGGIGEAIAPAPPLPPCWVVLANPGVELKTPTVFQARSGPFSSPARFDEPPQSAAALAALLAERRNDLERPAMQLQPTVADALAALRACPGALIARMAGSGATCFALFDDPGRATEATFALARARPTWWVKTGSVETDATRLDPKA